MLERGFDQGYPSLSPRQARVGLSTGSQRRKAPGWLVPPLMRPAHQSRFAPPAPPSTKAPPLCGKTLRGRRGGDSFSQKGKGAHLQKPVDRGCENSEMAWFYVSSPIRTCGYSTSRPCFSTSRPVFYICHFFAFHPLLLLFLNLLRGRERGIRRERRIDHFHKLGIMCKYVTTGWRPHPQVFRGCFFRQKPRPAWVCGLWTGHPRVFFGKCAPRWFGSRRGGV